MEVTPLKLTKEHFPLSRSLRPQVLDRFGQGQAISSHQALSREDLIDYLRHSENPQGAPLLVLKQQLEAMGDPAEPTTEDRAVLEWLGNALQDWESRYPLSEPLAQALFPLRPLASALAITDASFLQPGVHPLHRFFDQLVSCAVGWHPQLGRAGSALQGQVASTVEALLGWFTDRDTDLVAIIENFMRDSERDRDRAQRMAQRATETEVGKIKAAQARRQAAHMINEHLAKFKAPTTVGNFLRNPWFISAQLVLLKFGKESPQWANMSQATRTLLGTLQPSEELTEERRRKLFEAVTQVPKDLRRWLLSLHHDDEAVDEAVGLIEFAHMRILRQQPLELEVIDPIAIDAQDTSTIGERAEALRTIRSGQWFAISNDEGTPEKVRLTLNLEDQQQLLFTNHAGLKAMQLDYGRFLVLLTQRKVKRLHHHVSFSSCLARAAGIESVETLKALLTPSEGETGGPGDLAMGAWLGFHDGATPLLAKVAVHDQQRDVYIFVNRQGLKLRELPRQELLSLMERGLVDVIEAKSSFRGEVSRARENSTDDAAEN